jgi:branched-chain amino acid aminotransferase
MASGFCRPGLPSSDPAVDGAGALTQQVRVASEQDWGMLYGYGVFETVRVYDGVPFLLAEHLARMAASCVQLEIAVPSTVALGRQIRDYCLRFRDRLVRVTVTAGNPDDGMAPSWLLSDRPVSYGAADYQHGIAVCVAASPRDELSPLVRHKTLNQLHNVLECHSAMRRGFRETLFFNRAGTLAEASRSNVFVVTDGTVITPDEGCGLLPGVTRATVLALLRHAGLRVIEGRVTRDALLSCDECFLTNAHMEVLPVSRIEDHLVNGGAPGPVAGLAHDAYRSAVKRATAVGVVGGV